MKILVTGATGFVGKKLCRQLVSHGHDLVVMTRSLNSTTHSFGLPATFYQYESSGLVPNEALAGVDAVINLAGEPVAQGRWSAQKKHAIRESRIGGTRSLVAALAALPAERRPQVLISASAIGFYGDRGDEVLNEGAPAGHDFLSQVCNDWEQEALNARPLGIRVVCLRIGIVLGIEGGALGKMLPIFKAGVGGTLGDGRQWMSWIHWEDLVRMMEEALCGSQWSGAINAVAPEPVTNVEFTKSLSQTLGVPAVLAVPRFALKLALGEGASAVLASQRILPEAALQNRFLFRHANLSVALKSLF